MVPLDDEHWATEEVPDWTLCIHKPALPHRLYLYPCPNVNYLLPSYTNTMDLRDISDFEDIMITSSNEDIPALEDAHTKKLWFALNIILTLIYSINYHLLKGGSVNMFLTCVSNWLWFALSIILTLPYSITYCLSKEMHILICS